MNTPEAGAKGASLSHQPLTPYQRRPTTHSSKLCQDWAERTLSDCDRADWFPETQEQYMQQHLSAAKAEHAKQKGGNYAPAPRRREVGAAGVQRLIITPRPELRQTFEALRNRPPPDPTSHHRQLSGEGMVRSLVALLDSSEIQGYRRQWEMGRGVDGRGGDGGGGGETQWPLVWLHGVSDEVAKSRAQRSTMGISGCSEVTAALIALSKVGHGALC